MSSYIPVCRICEDMHITQLDMKPMRMFLTGLPLLDRRALELVARKLVLCARLSLTLVGDFFKLAAEPKGFSDTGGELESPGSPTVDQLWLLKP